MAMTLNSEKGGALDGLLLPFGIAAAGLLIGTDGPK